MAFPRGGQQQVHMVGHQHIDVDRAAMFLRLLPQGIRATGFTLTVPLILY